MKLSECQIGMIVQETDKYFNQTGEGRKDKKIGWIKDLGMNCTEGIILLVRFLYYDKLKLESWFEDIFIHPAHVEKYKE